MVWDCKDRVIAFGIVVSTHYDLLTLVQWFDSLPSSVLKSTATFWFGDNLHSNIGRLARLSLMRGFAAQPVLLLDLGTCL